MGSNGGESSLVKALHTNVRRISSTSKISIIRRFLKSISPDLFHPLPHEEIHWRAFLQSTDEEEETIRVIFRSESRTGEFSAPWIQGSFTYINLLAVQAVVLRAQLDPPEGEEESMHWSRFLRATEIQAYGVETRLLTTCPSTRPQVQVPRQDAGKGNTP